MATDVVPAIVVGVAVVLTCVMLDVVAAEQ